MRKNLEDFTTAAFRAEKPVAIEGLNQVMQKPAAGLAEFHKSNVGFGKTLEWKDEMSEVRERVERLSIVYPDLGPAAEPLMDRLEQLASAYPLVPSHSSFRPAQALLYKDQIGFIDFDSFCQPEPANFHACFARLDQSQSR